MSKRLMIVVPCYNEEDVLPLTISKLVEVVEGLVCKKLISDNSKIVFVNDGSKDKTWGIISKASDSNKYISGVNLAGNVGHQNALVAGLEYAKDICDVTVSIDADLQDDVSVIEQMILKFNSGADVVFGVRNDRKTDSFFKRVTAQGFYKFMNFMGVNTIYNHADYRLLSKRALVALLEYKERNLFLRGLASKIGFNTDVVYYSRAERLAGESKYPLKKMISFAWDGITSFSTKPISFLMYLGIVIIILTIVAFSYTIVSYLRGNINPGWSSLMISIWFLGGVQLFSIGMIGQYVGKTYIESKQRPRYHIKEVADDEN